jgi:SAM-dependent methyltransferase
VLEHVPRPWVVAQEIRRILKPNGVCVVTAPFLQASHADPDDYFRYTIAGLESLFGEPDFEILESGSQGRLYSILVDFIRMVSFNVYEKPKPYTWRLVRMLISLGSILDRMCSNKIIYMNSYVIARKK